jgi:hypothetical protein
MNRCARNHVLMRKVAVSLVVLITLGAPVATSQAEDLAPTLSELVQARAVAVAYWHTTTAPCGPEHVAVEVFSEQRPAHADFASCTITFDGARDWRDFPELTCVIYVHEFGHLVLGPTYFAAVNPTDPAHSPDPGNIMYSGLTDPDELEALEREVGCAPAPVTPHPRHHHRSRSHRPRRR